MVLNFNTKKTDTSKDEWLTPPEIWKALGPFDLDVCEPVDSPWHIGVHGFNKNDDGLKKEWFGRVWCNPPYGRQTFTWMRKLANHKSGLGLIFARMDTKGFHEEVFAKANSVFFFRGRLYFHHVDGRKGGRPNAGSVLVSYSAEDSQAIENAKFDGSHIYLCGKP